MTAGRDETWCDDNDVDCLFGLSRNARLTERVGRQLRRSRNRCVSTGKAQFRDFRYRTPGVVEPRAAGSRESGVASSRRPLRRDLPGPQAGGGAGPLRGTLRAHGENKYNGYNWHGADKTLLRAGRTE